MAAVRHAARRLGGSLLRGRQVAVAGEERRRLVHTDESARNQLILEIQQKKEALYDVIARAEKDFLMTNWWNRRLAQDLSVQVTPRPFDRRWRRLRNVKRVNSFVETAGVLSLSCILSIGTCFLEWPGAEKEKVAESMLASKSSGDDI